MFRKPIAAIAAALALGLMATTVPLTAVAQCARISTLDVAPRNQKLFPAVLIAVDGQHPGPSGHTFRIEPGRHELTVAEAIDSDRFSDLHLVQRARNNKRYKTLSFDAQPGVTYLLAVRFFEDKRGEILSGGYWEPVIWREKPESCR